MFKISTKSSLVLVLLFLAASPMAADRNWPLEGEIDLSSGFGDYRRGHFHFGIDLRTGGVEGRKVFSPIDGIVYRVRTSYSGYGKALYIKGKDDHIYVMAHLSAFAEKIQSPLYAHQIADRRYYQDIDLQPDSIRVKKGELVALSGKTGIGAPHLHFERRTADNFPVNPLTNGFKLEDRVRPEFRRLGFEMADSRSLFFDGNRQNFSTVKAKGKKGHYVLDSVPYFHQPVGFLVDCFDRHRLGGMKQTVYKLELFIDGDLHYRVYLDSLDFETNEAVSLDYDYVQAETGNKRVRRLWSKYGNHYAGSRAVSEGNGVIEEMTFGLHHARIVAEDCRGNKSELAFDFLWGPPQSVFTLDSTEVDRSDTTKITTFYFTAADGYEGLGIDSVNILMNLAENWGPLTSAEIVSFDDGKLICRVGGFRVHVAVLRLFLYTDNKTIIPDLIFNGLLKQGPGKPSVEHQVVEDGLLVAIQVRGNKGAMARVRLYYQDSLLGTEYPEYFHMSTYLCLIPAESKYARIDRIEAALSRDTTYGGVVSDPINIVAVGLEDNDWVTVDSLFEIKVAKEHLFQPRFLELIKQPVARWFPAGLNSDRYRILPDVFAVRSEFDIRFHLEGRDPFLDSKSGLCWHDDKGDRWIWLDNSRTDQTVTATSLGGGVFALIPDKEEPKIRRLNVFGHGLYAEDLTEISFVIEDSLSGIEDDRNIDLTLDSRYIPPEYDPETGVCKSTLAKPLEPGVHNVSIIVTDRAGNKTERYQNFTVKEGKKRHNRR